VGNNDASQHAHVVSSPQGPVSIVNGVKGYKLPGMSLDANGNLKFLFDLRTNIPETGTFYKFMPLEDGKIELTFQAASMNYYSYGIDGDAVYYGHTSGYNDNNDWSERYDRPNEQTVDVRCPYYLAKIDKQGHQTITKIADYGNGVYPPALEINDVKEGETYYLYGGWNATNLYFNRSGQRQNNIEYFPYGTGNGGAQNACGVAKLLKVDFYPKKKIYPLAKWVPNDTRAVNNDNPVPNPDTFAPEYELADLWGYNDKTEITVKKMSGNITACRPYLHEVVKNQHYKLMIDGITFDEANNKDKGGTILIKIGDTKHRENPVYTLTIAYSTDPTYDGNAGIGTRGHIWDYSSNSLHGFDWEPGPADAPKPDHHNVFTNDLTANSKYAQPADYGHYFTNYHEADISNYSSVNDVLSSDQNSLQPSGSGLLYKEIHAEEMHSGTSDWKFNYNLVNNNKLYDPVFLNKFDLEGDNADLIWETEGTVLRTSANSSVMFNEFTGADIHQSTKDPERYVGILKGGEFRIPWLRPNDRVIIYMGTGKGAFNDQAVFNIRGAYDAEHKEISESDDYIVGGSHWDGEKGDKNYRGCYHFFAKGHDGGPADMVFKMTSGSMCKIYSIQIYRGDRIITNEIVGATPDDNKYLLWSRAHDPNEPISETNKDKTEETRPNWTLKYLGKDQQLANGTGKNTQENEIIAQTGKYNGDPALTNNFVKVSQENDEGEMEEIATSKVESFTYKHSLGEIGTFRVRGKDMEKNMNYVADYADHNVTIAYQQTQPYPYTWDFMDMTGWGDNADYFEREDAYGSSPAFTARKPWFDNDALWNASYEKSAADLSLWGTAVGNDQGFVLRLNSQETPSDYPQDNIFESAQTVDGNPYYGNQLWANGRVVPESQGLWFRTLDQNTLHGSMRLYDDGMTEGGGVQWRYYMVVPNVPKDAAVYMRVKKAEDYDRLASYQFAGSEAAEMTLIPVDKTTDTPDEWIVAIKNDKGAKKHLTLSLVGYQLKKLAVSKDPKTLNKLGWATESRNRFIDPELTPFFTGENIEVCTVTGFDYPNKTVTLKRVEVANYVMKPVSTESSNSGYEAYLIHNTEDKAVEILNNGFHLFVPDMHDYVEGADSNVKSPQSMSDSKLKAQLAAEAVPATDNAGNTNFVLTYKYRQVNANDVPTSGVIESDHVAFYRVLESVNSKGNQGYLPVPTIDWHNQAAKTAKFTIIYIDDEEEDGGVVTGIENVDTSTEKATYYNLNGQKLNGAPTESGIYIRNGKKVLVKNI